MKAAILAVIIRRQVFLTNKVITEFLWRENVEFIPTARAFYRDLDAAAKGQNTNVEHSKEWQERGKKTMTKNTGREKQYKKNAQHDFDLALFPHYLSLDWSCCFSSHYVFPNLTGCYLT